VAIPAGIKVTVEKNVILISGSNKEDVGSFAARLRDLKKPEPYKGKGLRYADEVIKIKQGKKSV
jgi:large subunit ribosomal protein L6